MTAESQTPKAMRRKQTGRLSRPWLHKTQERSWSTTLVSTKQTRRRTASPSLGWQIGRRSLQGQRSMGRQTKDTNDFRPCSKALQMETFSPSSLPRRARKQTTLSRYTQAPRPNQIAKSQEHLCSVSSRRLWMFACKKTEWRTHS